MINTLRKSYHQLKRYYQPNQNILGRTACLGQDVFNLKYNTPVQPRNLINLQKVRVDMFIDLMNNKNRPKAKYVEPHMAREDIFPMIVQQEKIPWKKARNISDTILIDSFSELTDQKFVHKKDGWAFCCHYTDIKHTEEFINEFKEEGLLAINELDSCYEKFFGYINTRYPNKKIIFIHFPTKFDERIVFKERGQAIKNVVDKLAVNNKNLISVSIADDLVSAHEGDDFPYHYGKETCVYFVEEINKAVNANN